MLILWSSGLFYLVVRQLDSALLFSVHGGTFVPIYETMERQNVDYNMDLNRHENQNCSTSSDFQFSPSFFNQYSVCILCHPPSLSLAVYSVAL